MEFLTDKSIFPKNVAVILGFFDGIHAGHREVIRTVNDKESVLITFSKSPAEYFTHNVNYIYSRKHNYELLNKLGVNYVYERDFSDLINVTAEDYLKDIIVKFNPISITTGFNHHFGMNRVGNPDFLKKQLKDVVYNCVPPIKIDDRIVSSTQIKEFLQSGEIEKANKYLTENFILESKVIDGNHIGRTLGFPTANMKYPSNIVRLPYGVYKVKTLGKLAIMNWGVKPTIGAEEVLEVHILDYSGNLYGENLRIEILSKIRDEKKFDSLEDLKMQIQKDIQKCLEL